MNTKPPCIIVDIDGTIADIKHRLHYIDPTINVGDTVRPVGIPNAKDYSGRVVDTRNGYTVNWQIPKGGIGLKSNYCQGIAHEQVKKVRSWNKFFEAAVDDAPIQITIDVVQQLASRCLIFFCSGRPEKYRQITLNWMVANGLQDINWAYCKALNPTLLMRPDNDRREDYIVKKEILDNKILPYYNPILALDDRDQVVKMWRDNGITCWQVAEGHF